MQRISGDQKRTNSPPGLPGLPLLGNLIRARRNPLQFARDLAEQCGDVAYFRIGMYNGYLLSHPDHFRHVLKDNHQNYSKQNYNYRMLKPVLGEGLITSDGEKWAHSRKIIQPAFHPQHLRTFIPGIVVSTREMLMRWDDMADRGNVVDIAEEMMDLTLTIILRSLFDARVDFPLDQFRRAFTTLNKGIARKFQSTFPIPLGIPTPVNMRLRKAITELDRIVYRIIEQRRNDKGSHDDILERMVFGSGDGMGLTDRQLRDEVMTLLLAGHETTANLLAWTCYLLATHPEILENMRKEHQAVMTGNTLSAEDLEAMPYTDMVLQESLRLYPPVWIISRRVIRDDVIGGFTIPAGATVVLSSYVLHRHSGFWENPETFDPGRFAGMSKGRHGNPAHFPFGGGPRTCIGGGLAMMEAKCILLMVLQKYRLRLVPGYPVEPEPLVTLRPRYGLKMLIEKC